MAATIDDVYAQNQSIITMLNSIQTDITTLKSDTSTIKSAVNIIDDKIDLLSGDTTSTNVLNKVLKIERKVSSMEFKVMKGK